MLLATSSSGCAYYMWVAGLSYCRGTVNYRFRSGKHKRTDSNTHRSTRCQTPFFCPWPILYALKEPSEKELHAGIPLVKMVLGLATGMPKWGWKLTKLGELDDIEGILNNAAVILQMEHYVHRGIVGEQMDKLWPWREVWKYGHVFVFVQLMERPRPLQISAVVSSITLRSSHESTTMAMSYSRSVMIVSSCSFFLLPQCLVSWR